MRTASSIEEIFSTATGRIGRLRKSLPIGRVPLDSTSDRATAFVAIELMNQWVQFSRVLYLSSCRGAKDISGNKITCSVPYSNDNESLRIASNLFKRTPLAPGDLVSHRDEPDWLQPSNLLKALNRVGASNYNVVANALTVQERSLLDLPSVRNFFGHRAKNTAQKVVGVTGVIQHYRVDPAEHPTEFCLSYEVDASHSVLGTWLETINIVEEFACCLS